LLPSLPQHCLCKTKQSTCFVFYDCVYEVINGLVLVTYITVRGILFVFFFLRSLTEIEVICHRFVIYSFYNVEELSFYS
jgi:hypothetical protein